MTEETKKIYRDFAKQNIDVFNGIVSSNEASIAYYDILLNADNQNSAQQILKRKKHDTEAVITAYKKGIVHLERMRDYLNQTAERFNEEEFYSLLQSE